MIGIKILYPSEANEFYCNIKKGFIQVELKGIYLPDCKSTHIYWT